LLQIEDITVIHIGVWYNIRVGKEKSNLQQLENLINFSAMKPTARYTFSGVESLSFTSHDVSVRFQDGDSLTVDFSRGQDGLKMIHEECRDFLKWYGKRDMAQLKRTYEALRLIIEEEKKEELEKL
tara:strand:- start:69 stop:446 length:378 start_codon:yes stop_codon:yes gene_type:complete